MTSKGVVIGRFQVPDLHWGHRHLLERVLELHTHLVVAIGVSPLPPTAHDPLPFQYRRDMILREMEIYGKAISVIPVYDHPSDERWCENLDRVLTDIYGTDLVLYGSRDSFVDTYSGVFPTVCLASPDDAPSGSTVRSMLGREKLPHTSPANGWGAGVVWATQQQFPTVYTTVDVALMSEDDSKVALITKRDVYGYMFIGGFADPSSNSDKDDVVRETFEEAGVTATNIQPICDMKVDDWRYRPTGSVIRTRFYTAIADSNKIVAGDDAETVSWVDLKSLNETMFNSCHRPLYRAFRQHRERTATAF